MNKKYFQIINLYSIKLIHKKIMINILKKIKKKSILLLQYHKIKYKNNNNKKNKDR